MGIGQVHPGAGPEGDSEEEFLTQRPDVGVGSWHYPGVTLVVAVQHVTDASHRHANEVTAKVDVYLARSESLKLEGCQPTNECMPYAGVDSRGRVCSMVRPIIQ